MATITKVYNSLQASAGDISVSKGKISLDASKVKDVFLSDVYGYKLIPFAASASQVSRLAISVNDVATLENTNYKITVRRGAEAKTYSFISDETSTQAEVHAGLKAVIDADKEAIVSAAGASPNLDLTSKIAGLEFELVKGANLSNSTVSVVTPNTIGNGAGADIKALDSDIISTSNYDEHILEYNVPAASANYHIASQRVIARIFVLDGVANEAEFIALLDRLFKTIGGAGTSVDTLGGAATMGGAYSQVEAQKLANDIAWLKKRMNIVS